MSPIIQSVINNLWIHGKTCERNRELMSLLCWPAVNNPIAVILYNFGLLMRSDCSLSFIVQSPALYL